MRSSPIIVVAAFGARVIVARGQCRAGLSFWNRIRSENSKPKTPMLPGSDPRGLFPRRLHRSFVIRSTCQRPQKPMAVHVVLERLASIDEDYGHFVVVLLSQLWVAIDIHLAPCKVGIALDLRQRLFDYVAEMTSLARIHHHFVHKAIVSGCRKRPCPRGGANRLEFIYRVESQRIYVRSWIATRSPAGGGNEFGHGRARRHAVEANRRSLPRKLKTCRRS